MFAKHKGVLTNTLRKPEFLKTIYDPAVWTDTKLIKAAVEAARDAVARGEFMRKWTGLTKDGYRISGFQENGKITTFFFE